MSEPDRLAQQVTAQIRHLLSTCPRCSERDAQEEAWRAAAARRASEGPLTPRQVQVLNLLADGLTQAQIQKRLQISEGTTKRHVGNILDRLQVRCATAAVATALRRGLIT